MKLSDSEFFINRISIILILWVVISFKSNGQQLSIATQTNNNPELFNPSAWNTDMLKYSFMPKNEFFSYYRSHWSGFDLGPKYFGGHYNHIGDNKVISGIGFIHENFGPLSSSNISGQYAYKLKLNNRSFISGGLGLGLNFNGYDPTKITIRDQDDPIAENSENTFGLTFTPGIFFSILDKERYSI
ncbi:MAG: type IX secretion system membrane protein PorP/SprF [Saprospiraceae bacterium]|nr:type IX secretion system membrane protein PorP/SprF [Candidatus Defluviibacterium haderslevense]